MTGLYCHSDRSIYSFKNLIEDPWGEGRNLAVQGLRGTRIPRSASLGSE